MPGFMKTVFKNPRPDRAFFFLAKVDDLKIKRKISLFFLLHSFIYLPLIALLSLFFSLLHDLETAFRSFEIKVKYGW